MCTEDIGTFGKEADCVIDFEKVYSEYYDTVYRYILSLCKDEIWAEEITQETFFKALKKINSFRGECKLSVWLCQIAKNSFYTQAKKRSIECAESVLDSIPIYDTVQQDLMRKEDVLAIHKVLHTLNQPYQEVFWMRTFGELSFREIGDIFGKTESWARVTYHRAKMKIKEGFQ